MNHKFWKQLCDKVPHQPICSNKIETKKVKIAVEESFRKRDLTGLHTTTMHMDMLYWQWNYSLTCTNFMPWIY